jgi:hypothetical protein
MKVYSGKLVIDLSTVVETEDEKDMFEQAIQGLTSELLGEIRLLLGANGYWASNLSGELKQAENQNEDRVKIINSKVDAAKRGIDKVYGKQNIETIRLRIE